MPKNVPTPLPNLAYVDVARGIAILMVVLVHTAQSVSGLTGPVALLAGYGQMGVQLFFVASAFTLCRTFVQRRTEPRHIRAFFIRRFWRIAPLYYLGIVFYFGLALARQLAGQDHAADAYTGWNILANVLFIHGFVPAANNNIVPGGWSIGTEMAFYACFPVLFYWFESLRAKGIWALVAVIGAAWVVDVVFHRTVGRGLDGYSFANHLINQLPVFLLGMLGYFVLEEGRYRGLLDSRPWLAIGFAVPTGIAIALWDYKPHVMSAVLPTLAGISFFFLLNLLRLWRHPPPLLRAMGRVSFSIYIFHFIFAKILLKPFLAQHPTTLPPALVLAVSYVLVCLATFTIALVTERTIEKRGIAFGSQMVKRVAARASVA